MDSWCDQVEALAEMRDAEEAKRTLTFKEIEALRTMFDVVACSDDFDLEEHFNMTEAEFDALGRKIEALQVMRNGVAFIERAQQGE